MTMIQSPFLSEQTYPEGRVSYKLLITFMNITRTTKMRMKAVFDCSADEPGELSFKEGDILVDVVESGEEGWYNGTIEHTKETGLFPYNYVVQITDSPATIDVGEKPEIIPNSTTQNFKPTWQATSNEALLPSYPALDAFEAAMSGNKAKLSSPGASHPPIITSLKPALKNDAIKVYAGTSTFKKPQLKSITQQKESSPTRLRSYSASSVLNKTEKEPLDTEKILKPSQLLSGNGTKSALELALSKGSPKPPSNLRSNSVSTKTNATGIALVGMNKLNSNSNSSINTDVEDEDGYQMVKPSQLRQRTPKPINSQSTSWKKPLSDNKDCKTTTKLDIAPSSNPMPRLPSRPISTASRRSRNSRISTDPSLTNSNGCTTIKHTTNLSTVRETTVNEKVSRPIIKPKPQLPLSHQPHLPPRPKARSSSNPPPIQPKPAMSSIEVLMSRATNGKEKQPATNDVITTPSKSMTPPRIKKPAPPPPPPPQSRNFGAPSRPSLDNWRSTNSLEDGSNIKPSSILRARSSTNPASMVSDWNQHSKPVTDTPVVATLQEPRKKCTPPPPPPSRPPKSKGLTESKQRYEILFDTIHDSGYIDGETAQVIWIKSKLSNEDLARIWRECDPDHKGLLDKQAFIDGMSKIDEILLSKQQQLQLQQQQQAII